MECKFSTVEKKALSCVWVIKKWCSCLWGCRSSTDHSADKVQYASMHIARWSDWLLCFDYDVTYRPGLQNQSTTADCLSCLPLPVHHDSALDVEPEMIDEFLVP